LPPLATGGFPASELAVVASLGSRDSDTIREAFAAHCPNCGGQLKIIVAILKVPVIERILTHPGLQARVPPRAPARGQTPKRRATSKYGEGAYAKPDTCTSRRSRR